ncbi:uncharacterized protein LOC107624899 isoform X2 [Arachis ipaensis]|uniref:uncharacterized protein LOC107624899 isoform X2 n=1 Tax=Arachis ipaensis TaxID=130454 RepID=UPI000A2B976C|nr:uncharacterized protein LOC107624899 isoform X2 [Arachis ipaensis]XP_025632308.1 uncharacterized protein LOC112726948 isoform X2 [Arachis hypogaea]
MGALATLSSWTSEDNLLLKNAVEAGASLESLAKGVVQFSRRYSFKEIRDRWYSILYDPIISAEASASMTDFEISTSPLPSKFIKFGNSRERKIDSAKRKAESVRTSYYAMRKRIRSDMFNSMDLGFLVDPENDNYGANGNESLPENCVAEGEMSNHFGFHGSHTDPAQYSFPENMMNGGATSNGVTAHAYYTGAKDPVQDNIPAEQQDVLREEPQFLRDDVSNGAAEPQFLRDDVSNGVAEEMGVPEELAIDSFIGDDNLETPFDQINSDPGNLCSEFDGNDVFDSSEIECGTSFNSLHLSPLPEMPVWKTHASIQEPEMPCDDFKDSIACGEAYLTELSNSLLNFTNEEELYLMDVDGKDGIDKSYYEGLSSLLLSSPNDVSQDQMPEKAEAESSVASQPKVSNLSVSCQAKVDDNNRSQSSNAQTVQKSDNQVSSSVSVKDPRFPELTNGVVFCALNTEEPEVPCNVDVFLLPLDVPPSTSPYSSEWMYTESNKPMSSCVQDSGFSNHKALETSRMTKVEQKKPAEFRGSSQVMGSPPLPGPVGNSKGKNLALPKDRHLQHADAGSSDVPKSQLVAIPPTLDEEQYMESDDDVPCYSDIEAMILDMDLDPDDQDLFYNEEVSTYQHEETKRTIIRLEQGAHSSMQRAIALHEAIAILYGRYSKHYIKKAEVLLGRATEGVSVDIDLGKGGYANKISRRQAVIKLHNDGSFYIKNFGKTSILVNNKEVQTGQSQRLHSNCLIELRGMPFIFETNPSRVKQYLDQHITDNSQTL